MQHPNPEIACLLAELADGKLPQISLSLERIHAFLDAVGNPQDNLPPVLHVAGTNGKGSLLAYLKAILEAAGYKVHRLISPYLVKFNEEITLGGEDIRDDYLLDLLRRIKKKMEHYPLTFFEATTALALIAFAETPADIVLLETGLGGRLDSTNVVDRPLLTAIMPVSLDHTEFLGDTIAQIAAEKAGIIKRNVPCVIAPQPEEALEVCRRKASALNAPVYAYGSEWNVKETAEGFHYRSPLRDATFPLPGLPGKHQLYNAAAAIACIDKIQGFDISHAHIAEGIARAVWPARLQHFTSGALVDMLPEGWQLWLDGAHNAGAGEVLAAWLQEQEKPVHVICSILRAKEADKIITAIAPFIRSFTAIAMPDSSKKGFLPSELAEIAQKQGVKSSVAANAREALHRLTETIKEPAYVLVCGSLYLAGDILRQNSIYP